MYRSAMNKATRFLKAGVLTVLLTSVFFQGLTLMMPSVSAAVDTSDWQYCKKIVIDHTKVPNSLVNFPVLFDNTSADFAEAQADGDDFMFLDSSNNTQFHHEIESFASNRLIAWVNVTYVSSVSDTVVWLYYGNAGCSNQQQVTSVWSKYKIVQHLKDLTTSTTNDSTSNNYDGVKKAANNPVEAAGKIWKSEDFDNVDDSINVSSTVHGTGAKTITFWLYSEVDTDTQVFFGTGTGISSADNGWGARTNDGTTMVVWLGNGGTSGYFLDTASTLRHGCWQYWSIVYNGANLTTWYNGTGAVVDTTKSGSETAPDKNLCMGRSNNPSYYYVMNGNLDELRVMNGTRNVSWFGAEYNNQGSPSTFLSVGAEVNNPGYVPFVFPIYVSDVYPVPGAVGVQTCPDVGLNVTHLTGANVNITFYYSSGPVNNSGVSDSCVSSNLLPQSDDGDWGTYEMEDPDFDSVPLRYENYTIPDGVLSATYRMKVSVGDFNFSVPVDCFDEDMVRIRRAYAYESPPDHSISFYYDGSYWGLGAHVNYGDYSSENTSFYESSVNFTCSILTEGMESVLLPSYYGYDGELCNHSYYSCYRKYSFNPWLLNHKYYWFVNISDGLGSWRVFPNATDGDGCYLYNFTTRAVNNTDNITIYDNTVNTTGTNDYSFVNGSGWSVWVNQTGDLTPLTVFENIVNATGTHFWLQNNTGYYIWANYTGNGSGNASGSVILNVNGRSYTWYFLVGGIGGCAVGVVFLKRRRDGEDE